MTSDWSFPLTKIVASSLKDLVGNALVSIPVEIELVVPQGFQATLDFGIATKYLTSTDSSGNWQVTLTENDLIDPVGSLYRIKEALPIQYGSTRTYLIQVLSSLGAGVNQAHDLIVPALAPVGTINNYLTKSYADATYQPIGTVGSQVGPPGPVGATGATGIGLIVGGTTNQLLAKKSNTDYDNQWVDPGIRVVTSSTRPTSPPSNTLIRESDTGRIYRWDGTSWRYQFGGTNPTAFHA